ncbi:MAG: glycosyltransferase [Prevotella sp.]
MNFWYILSIIDWVLFIPITFTVIYITVFSIASLFSSHSSIPVSKRQNRFIVFIPSYRSDDTILSTVRAILGQTYPQRLFDVVVISDHQQELTNFQLAQYPVTLLTPDFSHSSKARSLIYALNNLPQFKIYDVAVILDADNVVMPEFLAQLNDAYETSGTKAIQVHRVCKNRHSPIVALGATFEEINNSVFRRGHITLGLSSALSGSGMAFDFEWFKENIVLTRGKCEDKELEALLLRDSIYVDYFDSILVFYEMNFSIRSLNLQSDKRNKKHFKTVLHNLKYVPFAIINKQYNFIDKMIQWILVPRTVMMTVILLMSVVLPFIYFSVVVKWWVLASFICFIFALATPDYLIDKNWNKMMLQTPRVLFASIYRHIYSVLSRKRTKS